MKKFKYYLRDAEGNMCATNFDTTRDAGIETLTGAKGWRAYQAYTLERLRPFVPVNTELVIVAMNTPRRADGTIYHRIFVAHNQFGKPQIREITRDVAIVLGYRTDSYDRPGLGGYGYSKSVQIAHDLGRALWPNGTPEPHSTRNGKPDTAGEYALTVNSGR